MEQENNKNEAEDIGEVSAKPQSSGKKSPNSLKARSKIAKSLAQNFVKTKNAKVTATVQKKTKKNKNKSISETRKKIEEKGKSKLISGEEDQHDNVTGKKHGGNGQQIEKEQENSTVSSDKQEKAGVSDDKQNKEQKDGDVNEKSSVPSDKQEKTGVSDDKQNKEQKDGDVNENSTVSYDNQEKAGVSDDKQNKEQKDGDVNENNTVPYDDKEKAGVSDDKENKEQKDGGVNENRNKGKHDGGKKRKRKGKEEKHRGPEMNNKNGEKHRRPEMNNKNGEKHRRPEMNNKNGEKNRLPEKNNKKGEKHDHNKGQQNEKKEKVDGLIFMCSAKTKPDCFRYQVMGVSAGKKDLVLGIRPGLKLFLYDFDLKLMYGIYKACSSGGMKVEPKAFGGAFPAQVRFRVHSDCYPLPENVFKKAIKENYNERNKFKLELTARQVRKLTELFRPIAIRSTGLPAYSPPREVFDGRRESRPHLERETSFRGPYSHVEARSYGAVSHGRDHEIAHRELASREREEIPHDLYLSEKEYRAYGLQGERRNLPTQHHIAPPLDPYLREVTRADPHYLREDTYRTYDLGARLQVPSTVAGTSVVALDSYPNYNYGAISGDSYSRSLRTESYSHAAGPLSQYNLTRRYQGIEAEAAPMPVSSRYSFATPSVSNRKLEL